jgi:hypothetical protein
VTENQHASEDHLKRAAKLTKRLKHNTPG